MVGLVIDPRGDVVQAHPSFSVPRNGGRNKQLDCLIRHAVGCGLPKDAMDACRFSRPAHSSVIYLCVCHNFALTPQGVTPRYFDRYFGSGHCHDHLWHDGLQLLCHHRHCQMVEI